MFIFSTTVFFCGMKVPMTICILISYILTSFKEMSWSIKFIKDTRPGLKRPAQVTMQQMQKKDLGPAETDVV